MSIDEEPKNEEPKDLLQEIEEIKRENEESRDLLQEIEEMKKESEETNSSLVRSRKDGFCETCPICTHPASEMLTKIYYKNRKSWSHSRDWFTEKFKRSYSENKWVKHFNEHVDPFMTSYEVIRKKVLNDLVEESLETKNNSSISQPSIIKQVLFNLIIDLYASKPNETTSKQEKIDMANLSKSIATLAKTHKEYQQMELDLLAYGKTEEEQKQIMKNYMTGMIRDLLRMFDGNEEVQEKISSVFGITTVKEKE